MYVVSLSNTDKTEAFITLWRPDNSGYCFSKEHAGIYPTPQKGYHDSDTNMPISDAQADRLWVQVRHDGNVQHRIRNDAKTLRELGLMWRRGVLIRRK